MICPPDPKTPKPQNPKTPSSYLNYRTFNFDLSSSDRVLKFNCRILRLHVEGAFKPKIRNRYLHKLARASSEMGRKLL